jgi:hypothetical protein
VEPYQIDSACNDLNSPSADEIIKLLTEEIKDINDVERLRGWTPWVILISIISASWIVVQDMWKGRYSWLGVTAIFLLVTASLQLVLISRNTLDKFACQKRKGPFQFLYSNSSVISFLVSSLWSGSIAWACYFFLTHANRAVFGISVFFYLYAILALLFLVGAMLVAIRFPYPLSQ